MKTSAEQNGELPQQKFINVALPTKTIDDLHALKKAMGVKSQTELIVKMVAIMKAIEVASRAA